MILVSLGAVHKLRYALFTTFWPPTYLWLCFCNDFTKHLLNKICNGYILLTTHPPQWHNVICERPLNRFEYQTFSENVLKIFFLFDLQEEIIRRLLNKPFKIPIPNYSPSSYGRSLGLKRSGIMKNHFSLLLAFFSFYHLIWPILSWHVSFTMSPLYYYWL